MVRKAIVALLALAPTPCLAQEEAWASIGSTGKSEVFADFASVRVSPPQQIVREFPVRKFWMKMDHSADRSVTFRTTLFYVAIDCDDRRYVYLQQVAYNSQGSVVASAEQPDASYAYKAIIPGSTMMTARKWICELPAREEK